MVELFRLVLNEVGCQASSRESNSSTCSVGFLEWKTQIFLNGSNYMMMKIDLAQVLRNKFRLHSRKLLPNSKVIPIPQEEN